MFLPQFVASLAFVSKNPKSSIFYSTSYLKESRIELHQTTKASHNEIIDSALQDPTFEDLCCNLLKEPQDTISLLTDDGERGIVAKKNIEKDGCILKIPLSSCIRDDQPPSWFEEQKIDDDFNPNHFNPSEWAVRLAASLIDLDLSLSDSKDTPKVLEGRKMWLKMMPDPKLLSASLPIHWKEDILASAKCTALEIANDSAYFARYEAVASLECALKASTSFDAMNEKDLDLNKLCNNALDLVQTRSCRVERIDGVQLSPPLRVIAPIFDFINHGSSHYNGEGSSNAYFGLEGEDDEKSLVVRARRQISENDQIYIDYGKSARPTWRCLQSYGFIPNYKTQGQEDELFEGSDECVAEVFYNGGRYEVSTHTIPTDLVEAAYAAYLEEEKGAEAFGTSESESDENEPGNIFPPEVALRLAKRISDAAFDLVIEHPESDSNKNDEVTSFDEGTIASELAKALRWSQHKVLLACAVGLRDYAAQESQ